MGVTGGDFRILPIDIETAPMEAFVWDARVDYVNHDMVEQHTTVICASYRHPDTQKIQTVSVSPSTLATVRNDRDVCRKIHALLMYCGMNNIPLVYQNGDRFDLPKLEARFIYYRFAPLPHLTTIDTLKAAKRFRFDYNRLDFLDKHLNGIGKVETRGWPMWRDLVSAHSTVKKRRQALREMVTYCEGDILALERLYYTLRPYMKQHPNVNMWKRTYNCCPKCGSKRIRYAEKPHLNKTRAYRRMSCADCHAWFREYMSIKDWNANPPDPKQEGMVA